MANSSGSDSWRVWGKHVLLEIERLNEQQEKIFSMMNQLRMDVVRLKVKSGLWGALGGLIPVVIGLGLLVLKSAK